MKHYLKIFFIFLIFFCPLFSLYAQDNPKKYKTWDGKDWDGNIFREDQKQHTVYIPKYNLTVKTGLTDAREIAYQSDMEELQKSKDLYYSLGRLGEPKRDFTKSFWSQSFRGFLRGIIIVVEPAQLDSPKIKEIGLDKGYFDTNIYIVFYYFARVLIIFFISWGIFSFIHFIFIRDKKSIISSIIDDDDDDDDENKDNKIPSKKNDNSTNAIPQDIQEEIMACLYIVKRLDIIYKHIQNGSRSGWVWPQVEEIKTLLEDKNGFIPDAFSELTKEILSKFKLYSAGLALDFYDDDKFYKHLMILGEIHIISLKGHLPEIPPKKRPQVLAYIEKQKEVFANIKRNSI